MIDPLTTILIHAGGFECFAPRSLMLRAFTEEAAINGCHRLLARGQLAAFKRYGEWSFHLPGTTPLLPTRCPETDPKIIEFEVKAYIERWQKRGFKTERQAEAAGL